MRAMVLAMTMMAVALVQAQSKPSKPMPTDVGSGRVAWFDITTTDLSKSKEFYGKLFEWTFNPVQGTDQAVEIVSAGLAIGTIRAADGQIGPFNGVVYVQVLDIQAGCKKATELGEHSFPDSPSTSQTAPEPSGSSMIQPAIPWGCTPGRRSRQRSPGPIDSLPLVNRLRVGPLAKEWRQWTFGNTSCPWSVPLSIAGFA